MVNHEREGSEPPVRFLEVERVFTTQGCFSIFQVRAQRLEDIEAVVFQVRSQGLIFGTPESFRSSTAKPFFKHVPIEYKDSELPAIVYLVGPTLSGN